MRFTIAHLLPLALLLNPILAAESEANSSAVTKPAASTAARHTTAAAASSTAKEEASATEESSGSATATGSAKNNKATSSGSDDETPTQTQGTLEVASWDPSAPATVAPDLNAGGISVRNSGVMGMGVAFGAVAMGINYL